MPLTIPPAHKPDKTINLDECILCQTKRRSEYLSSGEIGRARIVLLAKEDGGNDVRVRRVLRLTVPEQEIIKYHVMSCYKNFQREMEKKRKQSQNDTTIDLANYEDEWHSKRF